MRIEDIAAKVEFAEENFQHGSKKRSYVKTLLAEQWPRVKDFLLDTLIQLALVWAVKKGLIRK